MAQLSKAISSVLDSIENALNRITCANSEPPKQFTKTVTVHTENLLNHITELKADLAAGKVTEEEVLQEIQRIGDNITDYVDITVE